MRAWLSARGAHDPGLRLLPMTDDPVESYVDIPDAVLSRIQAED